MYNSVEDNGDVYFVPSFSGLFSPHWDDSARGKYLSNLGLIIGLSNLTKKGHIVRALYEAISFRTSEIIKAITQESKINLKSIKVDGGMTSSNELLQVQADISQIIVMKPKVNEITIIGAAIAAGLSSEANIWKSLDELKSLIPLDKSFNCTWENSTVENKLSKWQKAINRAKDWV